MKYSSKLSDAVHILVMIAINPFEKLSSNTMATSIQTNAAFIRRLMSSMRKAGLINCVQGQALPSLAKCPSEITLLDIYKAIEGDKHLLHLDTNINPECGVGVNIQYSLQDYYDKIQKDAEQSMSEVCLEDIIQNFYKKLETQGIQLKTLDNPHID